MDLAHLAVKIDSADVRRGDKDLERLQGTAGKTEKATNGLNRAFKTLGATVAAYLSFRVVIGEMGQMIKAASDLEETLNKFNVVFRGVGDAAEKWTRELRDGFAMSEREARAFLASVQDLLVPMGMARGEAGKLSSEIVKLSADIGSFNNLPTAQVLQNIRSALVGEYEPVRKFGIVIRAADLDNRILNEGLRETKDAITEVDRVMMRYKMILEGSTDAVGDMARSYDSYANQMKVFKSVVEDTRAVLGTALLPAITDVVKATNEWMKENEGLIKLKVDEYIKRVSTAVKDIVEIYRGLPVDVTSAAAGGVIGRILFGGWGPAGWVVLAKIVDDLAAKMNAISNIEIFPTSERVWGGYKEIWNWLKEIGYQGKVTAELIDDLFAAETWADYQRAIDAIKVRGLGEIFDPVEMNEYEKAVVAAMGATDSWLEKAKKFNGVKEATEEVTDAAEKNEKATKDQGDAYKETAEDVKHYTDALEKIKTDQANKEAEQWNGVLAIQRQIREEEQQYQEDKLDEAQKLQEEITREQEKELKKRQQEYDRIWDQMLRDIQRANSSTIREMLDGNLDSWRDYGDSILDIMKNTLAQIASAYLQQKIILPVMSQFIPGAANLLGGPTAGTVSGGGLGMPSFNSMGDLPGMGWLSTTLPGTTAAAGVSATGGIGAIGGAYQGPGMGAAIANAGTGGVTIGSALGAGALGALGYSTIGSALGLPQSQYSGITAGLGGAAGMWGGSALAASATSGMLAGATAGSVVPVVGTIIGAALGGILGGALGGGDEENTFTLTELTPHLDTDLSGSGLFDPTGFRHPNQGNAWYKPIANKYFEIVEGLQNEFNAQVELATEVLGLKDNKFAKELAKFDYTPQAQGRWTVSDAENAIEEITTEYAKKLRESISTALGKSGYPVIKEIYEEIGGITTELVQVMSVVPDGIERIAEYMNEGLTAVESIEQVQLDYQKVSGVLSPALNQALTASVQSLALDDFKESFSKNILEQVQGAVLMAAQSRLMDSLMTSLFDPILDLDSKLADYFAGDISVNRLSNDIDGMMDAVKNAVDAGAFDKFVEVVEELGLAVEGAAGQVKATISDLEYSMAAEGGRHRINEMFANQYYPGTFMRSLGVTQNSELRWIRDIFEDQKVTWQEADKAWHDLNDKLKEGAIDANQYKSILDYILNAHDDLLSKEKELANARRDSAEQIDDLIHQLRGGDLAPVQSMEYYESRYDDLSSAASSAGTAQELNEAISKLTGFVPDLLTFASAYGGDYQELYDSVLSDLKTLKPEGFVSGGYHPGGWRIVGEQGPEVEFTGASRISSTQDSVRMIADAVKRSVGSDGGNVTVKVYIDGEELKNTHVVWHKTDDEVHDAVRREVA